MKWLIVLLLLIPSVASAGVPPGGYPPPPMITYAHADIEIVDTGVKVKGDTVTAWMTVQANNSAGAWSDNGHAGLDMMFDAMIYTSDVHSHDVHSQARSEVRMFDVGSPASVKGSQNTLLTLSISYARTGSEGWVKFSADAFAGAWAGYWDGEWFKQSSQDWDFETLRRYWRVLRRTSLPTAEHVVWHLPPDAWWVDLQRVELDGSLTDVPPLYPANQLPSPVHGDLMIHGSQPCDYVMRVCYQDGRCDAPKTFTVNYTGSQGLSEVW